MLHSQGSLDIASPFFLEASPLDGVNINVHKLARLLGYACSRGGRVLFFFAGIDIRPRRPASLTAPVSVKAALFFRGGPVSHDLKADVRIRISSAVAAVAPN
jgi:hypothetical protein